jgi:hypothetical protein
MDAALLNDGRLHLALWRFDEDLAAEQRALGCPRCGAKLHWARYPRKPRGVPREWRVEYGRRLSLCCARRDCRKRATPASVRFLGPKVYLGAVVVLIAALRCGPTPTRVRTLQRLIGVDRRTIARWRQWWTRTLVDTPFWRQACAQLMPPVAIEQLPASLLERFAGQARDRLLALLQWLAPVTDSGGCVHDR